MTHRSRRCFPALLTLLPVVLASCVDAPSAPEGLAGPAAFVVAPQFSLQGPTGPATSEDQESALAEAFDQVDRFRMEVRRASDGTLVLDTVITVTPGAEEYDLSVNLDAQENEQFLVTLTALKGDVELFTAENIPATATPAGVAGGTPPTPIEVPLTYSGPGATAASVSVAPGQVVLAPGGTATVGAGVLDGSGTVIADVPLSWGTSNSGVATVSGGQVSAGGEGVATVTATTPTGLAASATVYVVAGELAYVEEGTLKVRGAAGGTPEDRGTGASQPSWSADGDNLFYTSGGVVQVAGSGPVLPGSWPSLSPDGTKLAVERGGQVFFANANGSMATPGPSGTAPVWRDGSTLLVGGGSVQSVRADGANRQTVMDGAATLPALGPDGRVAALVSGEVRVAGGTNAVVTGAVGRPSWSPSGVWLVVATGSGLVLAPADGTAAPVALPGLGSASDPAFRPQGVLAPPPSLTITGFSPDPPVPGTTVQLLGSGFDWIIPGNNQVHWPTQVGSQPGQILGVSQGALTAVMPRIVTAGQIRVQTAVATALVPYEPTVGGLDVTALAPWGGAVANVGLSLSGSGSSVDLSTDANGEARFAELVPGTYTLTITPPDGWTLDGDTQRNLTIGAEISSLSLTLTPGITDVALSPANPSVEVGGTTNVSLVLTGPGGISIPEAPGLAWRSASGELAVTPGAGLGATLEGVYAGVGTGSSTLEVDVDGATYTFPVSVTSQIEGVITLDPEATGASGVIVDVKLGGAVAAQATTGPDGSYQVPGLFQGTYDVVPQPLDTRLPVPAGQTVILDDTNPMGAADFLMVPFARLEVTSLTPSATPVGGVVVTLVDGNGQEAASGTTDGEGGLELERIPPGTYTATIAPPSGFELQGPAVRTLDLEGTTTLALVLNPLIAKIELDPASPVVEVGSTLHVTAIPLDYNGNPISEIRSSNWFARSSHLTASGSTLVGTLTGVYPSAKDGARFSIEVNGQIFELGATVTGYIQGTVTKQDGETTVPASLTKVTLEQGGAVVLETTTDGLGHYEFRKLPGGTYTVKVEVPEGSTAYPASYTVILDSETPSTTANFLISSYLPGGAGEVIVLGDINYWGSGSSYLEYQNNKEMTRNFVTNDTRWRSVWYFGHNTYNYYMYNENYFSYTAAYIRYTLERTLDVVDNTTTGGLNLPMDAASWWFWMPQAAFDATDIAYINTYLDGGGRLILVGENDGSGFNLANQRVQELMWALGSTGTYTDGCLYGTASDVTADPLTQDIVAIQTACSSYVVPGPGDQSLIRQSGKSVVTRIRRGLPVVEAPVTVPFVPAKLQAAPTEPAGDPALGPVGSVRDR